MSTARLGGVAALLAAALLSGCTAGPETSGPPATPDPATPTEVELDEELRARLVAMEREDQLERTGGGLPPGTKLPPPRDYYRVEELKEVIAEHGWPTESLVGADGASAAWLVAQHADFDVDFQEEALVLLREAAADGEADVTEVAYLADRVAVNRGRPQEFGTQVRCRGGEPRPATPLTSPDDVDARREAAGMEPLADYYAELSMMCAQEQADGLTTGP